MSDTKKTVTFTRRNGQKVTMTAAATRKRRAPKRPVLPHFLPYATAAKVVKAYFDKNMNRSMRVVNFKNKESVESTVQKKAVAIYKSGTHGVEAILAKI